jgi:hypothetical protein
VYAKTAITPSLRIVGHHGPVMVLVYPGGEPL